MRLLSTVTTMPPASENMHDLSNWNWQTGTPKKSQLRRLLFVKLLQGRQLDCLIREAAFQGHKFPQLGFSASCWFSTTNSTAV